MEDQLRRDALSYHRGKAPGKLRVQPTKPLKSSRDLALAYSPGAAAPCEAIAADPDAARLFTGRGNLVAVVTNGTAVLGLGDVGPLAAKPVMEGKAALFKVFAGIDAFDIEVDARDPDRFVEIVAALEPTFGGINLEDIRAPECFEIERRLRERMDIPVFHDDQHGTAVVCAAAVLNGLSQQGKRLKEARLVTCGAGAAALASVDLLVGMGLRPENLILTDIDGVVCAERANLAPHLAPYARPRLPATLAEALCGTDVFLGLSAGGALRSDWLEGMADKPLILALANPEPEIDPAAARLARPDAVVATGRSDQGVQVNNLLSFPYIFRGALDVGATEINERMKIAAAKALAELASADASCVRTGLDDRRLLPGPFDPRLLPAVSTAVAAAAMASGVARRPMSNLAAYQRRLEARVP